MHVPRVVARERSEGFCICDWIVSALSGLSGATMRGMGCTTSRALRLDGIHPGLRVLEQEWERCHQAGRLCREVFRDVQVRPPNGSRRYSRGWY